MDRDSNQVIPREGMDVYGADNEKIGAVDTVEQDYFVVRKGFFFPEDHYIPFDAVSTSDDDGVYLRYTKDQVLEQQWANPPQTTADYGTAVDYDTTAAGTVDTTDYDDTARTGEVLDRDVVDQRDETSIPVHEEELVARRRPVDRGDVEVEKHVVEEEAEVDVPVTEERVEVSRRPVDRDVQPGEEAFDEGEIEIPVHGEEVEVDKQARVVEEVDVDKTATQRTEHVSDTVRREDVEIEGEEVAPDTDQKRNQKRRR